FRERLEEVLPEEHDGSAVVHDHAGPLLTGELRIERESERAEERLRSTEILDREIHENHRGIVRGHEGAPSCASPPAERSSRWSMDPQSAGQGAVSAILVSQGIAGPSCSAPRRRVKFSWASAYPGFSRTASSK